MDARASVDHARDRSSSRARITARDLPVIIDPEVPGSVVHDHAIANARDRARAAVDAPGQHPLPLPAMVGSGHHVRALAARRNLARVPGTTGDVAVRAASRM